ncbi:MAG: amidohydrolase [Candidatus Zixiibacteriota bacterium]
MGRNKLFFNGNIYTQADNIVADSMAISSSNIIAIGKNLQRDDDFKKFEMIDLCGQTILPGFTDSHTHFAFMAVSLGNVKLDGKKSLEDVLICIKNHCRKLKKDEWMIGEGFSPDQWNKYIMPDKFMLDKITHGRPAAIFSKDTHLMWANSEALKSAGYDKNTMNPKGGLIERLSNGELSGILKEIPAYFPVYRQIKRHDESITMKLFKQALRLAYSKGVTAVHSFDGPEALKFYVKMAETGKLGLRINYYPPGARIDELVKNNIRFNYGDDYFRISGVKLFADGALGSQTAFCFSKYIGSQDNFGVEVTTKEEILRVIKKAARLNLPCAIHAIGDRAIANVLDCFEKAPALTGPARHRIEHLQMMRRKDISRLKKLGITASMQPSHCLSDIQLVEKYWGNRGRNCYIFKTLQRNNIPLAFGSDNPIEPLDPLAGIAAAVNRKSLNTKQVFYPEEKITVSSAVYGFTAGAAYAVGQEFERGFLLPGYRADFVILDKNLYKIPPSKLNEVNVIKTYFDGKLVYSA